MLGNTESSEWGTARWLRESGKASRRKWAGAKERERETGAYRQGRGLWARWQMALCARLRGLNLFPTGDGEPYWALLIMMVMLLILSCLLHGRHYSKR